MEDELLAVLDKLLELYGNSFGNKEFEEEPNDVDDLMLVFGLTQPIKATNKQYWGRELGMLWQRLIIELFRKTCPEYSGAIRENRDEICDLVVGRDAIDTKYRIGSGDSGTLKKFKSYGARLIELGFRPVMLILRRDNLDQAISAIQTGGWLVLTGEDSYKYIYENTGFDFHSWLTERYDKYNSQ